MKKIKIRTPSRVHLGLIDMEGSLGRVDGGIGIALEKPSFEISFEKPGSGKPGLEEKDWACCAKRETPEVTGLEGDAKNLAEDVCRNLMVGGVKVTVEKSIPEHIGLGSKTQLYLAIAAGIYKLYGIHKPVRELAKEVGRGGTSGVGVAAFEQGGLILDGGHSSDKGFSPSSFSNADPAPLLARYDFPWWVVCAWPDGKGAHGKAEMDIFQKYCPIPAKEVEGTSRIILMKMLPAIVEKNLLDFGAGLNMLQEVGFKKIELGLQDSKVKKVLEFLRDNSAGAGMSSFGPLCIGICNTVLEAERLCGEVANKFGFNTMATKANNEGAKWI